MHSANEPTDEQPGDEAASRESESETDGSQPGSADGADNSTKPANAAMFLGFRNAASIATSGASIHASTLKKLHWTINEVREVRLSRAAAKIASADWRGSDPVNNPILTAYARFLRRRVGSAQPDSVNFHGRTLNATDVDLANAINAILDDIRKAAIDTGSDLVDQVLTALTLLDPRFTQAIRWRMRQWKNDAKRRKKAL